MFKKIKQFFDSELIVSKNNDNVHPIQLATTALFIEVMLQDGKEESQEKNAIVNAIQNCLDISDDEVQTLYSLANEELKESTDYFQFTKVINAHYKQAEKIKIIENLWLIAYSDSHLDELEEHMIRKISELIYVPHTQFIRTKLYVQKELDLNKLLD